MTTDVKRTPGLPPVTTVDQLAAYFHAAGKPRERWRLGMEHEKIGVVLATGMPVTYEGPQGIAGIFGRLVEGAGWAPLHDGDNVIALERGKSKVTLEPGGQFELSAAPQPDVAAVRAEFEEHSIEVAKASEAQGVALLGVGTRPCGSLESMPWVPKQRYRIMWDYLGKRDTLGRDMMKRTATIQANVDWLDEDDAEKKFRASMALQAIATAVFANSPIIDGRETEYDSYRAHIWHHTDPDRCGILPLSFETGGGGFFRRYAEWAMDVPMFFVSGPDGYHAVESFPFRRFMREGLDGHFPTLDDWELHLSTLFPDVRIKGYLEVRGADSGPMSAVYALAGLWRGLFYDQGALDAADELLADLTMPERLQLSLDVARTSVRAQVPRHGTARDVARQMLAIARDGLGRLDAAELGSLAPLDEVVESGRPPADRVRDTWRAVGGCKIKFSESLRYQK